MFNSLITKIPKGRLAHSHHWMVSNSLDSNHPRNFVFDLLLEFHRWQTMSTCRPSFSLFLYRQHSILIHLNDVEISKWDRRYDVRRQKMGNVIRLRHSHNCNEIHEHPISNFISFFVCKAQKLFFTWNFHPYSRKCIKTSHLDWLVHSFGQSSMRALWICSFLASGI